ncbi:HDOD domain-containing protein [Shewanella sp. GutDb-MelDb]|uniref:HDOD domain-containing protein n=1 Tax=Shewanella sp. GutDb-MelDb TaxID=2058316 RepID=UPI000C796482|nr:HDOD domain-containing protein [Shewanella sp. GutDb-MelDb]PKG57514.1 histidine kinase [Shewanella sp. GutDb-MelDb]
MQDTKLRGADYWTHRISEQEMPALCSTVKTLEKLAKDDISSLAILGQSVMHDNALTSRILRVANSVTYSKGITQVTTVSKAAVVLGFDAIKNICITAKLLSSLLETEGLSEGVYKRLLGLMAQAFQAAMLTKMLMHDHDEELQEEVFIASLLYHIGESAFWGTGCAETLVLDAKLNKCQSTVERDKAVREVLGTSFQQLSAGIARSWGLGSVLIKSLSQPDERTPEIRSIFLANKLSQLLSQTPPSILELSKRLKQTANILNIEIDELKARMIRCHKATEIMADAYGAHVLIDFLPDVNQLILEHNVPEPQPVIRAADVFEQLKCLRALTQCALNKADFNQVLSITLQGVLKGVGVDRCAVLLLTPNRKALQPRIVLGDGAAEMKNNFTIDLNGDKNLFQESIQIKSALFVDNPHSSKWRLYMDDTLRALTSPSGFMVAPLIMNHTVIGVLYADKDTSGRRLSKEDFVGFSHFAELSNVCFSAAVK